MATGKDFLDKISSIQNSDGGIGYHRDRATMDGALVGMAIGLFFGFAKKKNMLVFGMLGAVGGAIVGRALMPKQ